MKTTIGSVTRIAHAIKASRTTDPVAVVKDNEQFREWDGTVKGSGNKISIRFEGADLYKMKRPDFESKLAGLVEEVSQATELRWKMSISGSDMGKDKIGKRVVILESIEDKVEKDEPAKEEAAPKSKRPKKTNKHGNTTKNRQGEVVVIDDKVMKEARKTFEKKYGEKSLKQSGSEMDKLKLGARLRVEVKGKDRIGTVVYIDPDEEGGRVGLLDYNGTFEVSNDDISGIRNDGLDVPDGFKGHPTTAGSKKTISKGDISNIDYIRVNIAEPDTKNKQWEKLAPQFGLASDGWDEEGHPCFTVVDPSKLKIKRFLKEARLASSNKDAILGIEFKGGKSMELAAGFAMWGSDDLRYVIDKLEDGMDHYGFKLTPPGRAALKALLNDRDNVRAYDDENDDYDLTPKTEKEATPKVAVEGKKPKAKPTGSKAVKGKKKSKK